MKDPRFLGGTSHPRRETAAVLNPVTKGRSHKWTLKMDPAPGELNP